MIAPESPRQAPTIRPTTVRGTRSERTMRCSFDPSKSVNALNTVPIGIGFEP